MCLTNNNYLFHLLHLYIFLSLHKNLTDNLDIKYFYFYSKLKRKLEIFTDNIFVLITYRFTQLRCHIYLAYFFTF